MVEQGTAPPAISEAENEAEDRPETYCFKAIVRHTMQEAGESKWAPNTLLFLTRLLGAVALLVMCVIAFIKRTATRDVELRAITYVGLIITYFALTLCTIFTCCRTPSNRSASTIVATAVVYAYAFFGTFAVFMMTDLFHLLIRVDLSGLDTAVLVLPFGVYLVDVFVMQARVRMRFRYIISVTFFYLCYVLIKTGILVTRGTCSSVPASLCALHIPQSVGHQFGGNLFFVAFLPIAADIAVGLTRLPWPCYS